MFDYQVAKIGIYLYMHQRQDLRVKRGIESLSLVFRNYIFKMYVCSKKGNIDHHTWFSDGNEMGRFNQ